MLGDRAVAGTSRGASTRTCTRSGFAADRGIAFIGGDGGVARIDVSQPVRTSRTPVRPATLRLRPRSARQPARAADDLRDCQLLLSAIPNDDRADQRRPAHDPVPVAVGQPEQPAGELLGGTQDNGTCSYTRLADLVRDRSAATAASPASTSASPTIRYHNYFDATPEVNFHGDDPTTWLAIYDPLQPTGEARSFYTPFVVDPTTPGRAFIGLEHVWRTDDNGGDQAYLRRTATR